MAPRIPRGPVRPAGRRRSPPAYPTRAGQIPPGIDPRFFPDPGESYGDLPPGSRGPGAAQPFGGGATIDRALQVYPPELYPIVGAQEFRKNEQFASAAAGVLTPAALQTVLPDRYVGVIRVFSYGLLLMLATTVVKWELLFNGGPVAGQSFTFFPGPVPRITANEDLYLRVPMGTTIDVRFTNTDGAAYTVGAGYYGWFWQPAGAEAWTGSAS